MCVFRGSGSKILLNLIAVRVVIVRQKEESGEPLTKSCLCHAVKVTYITLIKFARRKNIYIQFIKFIN